MKRALIFGITGQDGSYLAELLIEKGYKVFGVVRRNSGLTYGNIEHLKHHEQVELIYGDLSDTNSIKAAILKSNPDEVYNLAAQSHVRVSFDVPEYTFDITGTGTMRILESIRLLKPDARFYQASSSEMFGMVMETPQKETTPFYPRSPYGVAKVASYWATKNYRESYGMHASSGVLFNHESTRRGPEFVTRKITLGMNKVLRGEQECIELGNLDSKRDWGHAKDYVNAMWLMLQKNNPDDYIISTGETHSIREFCELAFKEAGSEIFWEGYGIDEVGRVSASGKVVIRINPSFYRPAEVDLLLGDSSKARNILGWKPEYSFEDLVREMVRHDYKPLA